MTLPSNEELQRLLDEATPGEWHLHEDEMGDPEGTFLHDTKGAMCISITPIGSGSDYRKSDLDLAALAPVLAAEVIRLRKENERMQAIVHTAEDMDVETDIVRSHPRGGVIGSYESPWYVDQPEGTVMRRFVGEWEEE